MLDDNLLALVDEEAAALPAFTPLAAMDLRELALHQFKHREPLLLQLVGGFSCEEIAQQLGITASAVMTQLFRARAKLGAVMRGEVQGKVHGLL